MWLKASGRGRCSDLPGATLSHAGLGYTRCAPLDVLLEDTPDPKAWLKSREHWLNSVVACEAPDHYGSAYERWARSLRGPDTLCFTVRAVSRILIGQGTSSATGVGLTLHHTWGVPMLPGSALKGLAVQFVQTVYGPDPGIEDPEREPFRGGDWEGRHPHRPPGAVFRRLFGAPDVEPDARGSQGEVIFHDALWVPSREPMLARDVLTVHQRSYYESAGGTWPVDYDDPNPVPFLTVAPDQRFLVALEARGERELLERAARYLCEALAAWGVGGKTVAGYGRLVREKAEPTARGPEAPVLTE